MLHLAMSSKQLFKCIQIIKGKLVKEMSRRNSILEDINKMIISEEQSKNRLNINEQSFGDL